MFPSALLPFRPSARLLAAIAEKRQSIRLSLPMRTEKWAFLAESLPRWQSLVFEMRFFRNCGRQEKE